MEIMEQIQGESQNQQFPDVSALARAHDTEGLHRALTESLAFLEQPLPIAESEEPDPELVRLRMAAGSVALEAAAALIKDKSFH